MSAAEFYSFASRDIGEFLKPAGFKKYRRYFYRITEDGVVQQFCLLWLYGMFTIRFGLSSVYNENDRTREGTGLYRLIDGSNRWICDPTGNVTIGDCVYERDAQWLFSPELATKICKHFLTTYLLPFFDKNRDSASACRSMLKYESVASLDELNMDYRLIGFYLADNAYGPLEEVLKYYIANKDKWNKLWWAEKETEFLSLYKAVAEGDLDYLEKYKNVRKRQTYSEFKLRPE